MTWLSNLYRAVVEEAVVGPTHPRGPGAVVFAKVVEEGERKGDGEGGVEEEVVGPMHPRRC